MLRWIIALTVLSLSGCVTTREVVYRDGYGGGSYTESRYSDSSYQRDYNDGNGSYYSPSYAGSGDYYYGQSYGSAYYSPSWYVDYPAYYSVFWPLYRTWYDPYYTRGYYYGVTYFPRNYLSIGYGYNHGFGSSYYGFGSSWHYSPYRYSWADNYYDWSPWDRSHSNRHGRDNHHTPRYGSARNEAERLSRLSDARRYYNVPDRNRSDAVRGTAYGTYGTSRSSLRDADYSGRAAPRQDPGVRGFGLQGNGDVRRSEAGSSRTLPSQRGFGVDSRDASGRYTPKPEGDDGRNGVRRDASNGAQREIGRVGGERGNADYVGQRRSNASYGDTGAPGARDAGIAMPRREAPAVSGYPRGEARGYAAPEARTYQRNEAPAQRNEAPARSYRRDTGDDSGGARYSAPAPRYSSESGSVQAPAPRYPAPQRNYSDAAPAPQRGYSAPQQQAPQYSAPERGSSAEPSESRSDNRSRGGNVRRTGSDRDQEE